MRALLLLVLLLGAGCRHLPPAAPTRSASPGLWLSWDAVPGALFTVERSTDFRQWLRVTNTPLTEVRLTPTAAWQFYRLGLQVTNTVGLAWDPSPAPFVTGYYIYARRADPPSTNRYDAGPALTYTVPVEPGSNWFHATAYVHETVQIESNIVVRPGGKRPLQHRDLSGRVGPPHRLSHQPASMKPAYGLCLALLLTCGLVLLLPGGRPWACLLLAAALLTLAAALAQDEL